MTGIYTIRNKVNGKMYVGQSIDYIKRKRQHKARYKIDSYKDRTKLYRAMNKYGFGNFEFTFIEGCSKDKLNEREKYWVEKYGTFCNGYNATPGGNACVPYWTGKKRDPETVKLISEKLRGTSWGKHSKETREELSQKMIGNKRGNKRVLCVELNLVFESVRGAAEALKINTHTITQSAKGRVKKSRTGFTFRYLGSQETIPKGSTLVDELPMEAQDNSFIRVDDIVRTCKMVNCRVSDQGILALAWRTNKYKMIYAEAVCKNDKFSYTLGLRKDLNHQPAETREGEPTHYYAVYHLTNGGYDFKVWTKDQVIEHAKKFSASYKAQTDSPWKTDFDSMAKKTVLKDLFKLAPKSIEFARALTLDETVRRDIKEDMDLVPAIDVDVEESLSPEETKALDAEFEGQEELFK
jgi:group I intron endonuclease